MRLDTLQIFPLIRCFALDAPAARDNHVTTFSAFLHLPVQSGSDRILKAMHRGHDREHYIKLVEAIREARPDIAISSDFIVGFPGETDEDFADTLDLVRRVRFDTAFSFNYSPRPGTPASKVADSVPQAVKDARLQELLAVLRQQTREFHHAHIGRVEEVLVERPSKSEGDMQGRTPDFKIVHFAGKPDQVGQLVQLRITGAYGQSLRGELTHE